MRSMLSPVMTDEIKAGEEDDVLGRDFCFDFLTVAELDGGATFLFRNSGILPLGGERWRMITFNRLG